jgi:Carboxypeptidase regulatory-like domain
MEHLAVQGPSTRRKYLARGQAYRAGTLLIALVAMLLVMTPHGWGQDNATITGYVTDASGALVPNAAITLTNTATNQTRETISNSAGTYRFANVGIGTYTLNIVASSFQKYTKTGIVVNVAQTVEADAMLSVGNQTQTVTVAADALQVQTETSEVSTLINGEQVSQLATNGRNITSLAALGMGVSNNLPPFGGVNALTSSNGISFNGTRQTHNIYMIDGGEQNDRGCGGCFMNLPSQDAIAQFQTLDSNYSPDYGIGSGGTILMVLKSGTNRFHGELYEFNRNTAYNANDYFLKAGGKPRSKFQLNIPGGNIGGPLFIPHVYNENRNRTFFFWNEEWRRLIQGSAPSVTNAILEPNFPTTGASLAYTPPSGKAPLVPITNDPAKLALYASDGLTAGNPFPGNIIPANLIDQNAVLQLNAGTFPRPNFNNGTQYIASIPQPTNVREDIVRIDHAINSKYQLMGHYLHDTLAQDYFPPLWGNSSYPTVGTAMNNPSFSAVIKLTQTYSPNLLNETAFLYSGNKITLTPVEGPGGGQFVKPTGWSATSFFPDANNRLNRMPEVQLQGSPINVTWSPSYYPWKNGYEGFNYRDDVSWTKGRHQFKFGAGWLHTYKNQELQYNTNGVTIFNSSNFSGDSYVNYLLGMATSYSQLEFLYGKHWVNNNYNGYVNDNWHVSSRTVLNIGFRYDGLPHAFERYDKFSNFVPALYDSSLGYPLATDGSGTLLPSSLSTFPGTTGSFYLNGIREAGVDGFPRGNVHDHYYTFQPRVGFAYDVTGNGKTVVRGGAGLFYERVQGNDVYNAALNPPFAYIPSATNVYFSNPNTSVLNGLTTQNSFPSSLTNIRYDNNIPGTANFSLGIQREVKPSMIAVVQYVGSNGFSQNNDRAINTLPLNNIAARQGVAGRIPDPANPGKFLAPLNANQYRIFPGFAGITQEENQTNFTYNSLQAGFRVENRHGLTTQVAYTWGHNISIVPNDLNIISNPFNAGYDKGSDTSFDRRQILNVSYVYALPWYNKSPNTFARLFLGGWTVSGITFFEKGVPVRVNYTGSDVLGLGGGTSNRPNLVSKVTYPKTFNQWFSTSSFADPVAPWLGGPNQGFGNAGKDAMVGPGIQNWNISVFKSFPFTSGEGPRIDLRFESFNTFNHTNPQGVNTNNHDGNFGKITSDYGPRTLQLGGKFVF